MTPAIRRGYVPAGRRQVHFRRAGDPQSPLLVLLHQTPSTSAMFEPLMARLSGTFDVVAPDTPGFGQSDPLDEPFSIATAASAIAAAVRWIRKEAAGWFGHHTGAALALQVAATHEAQVSRLALSGPCLLDDALREKLPQMASPVPSKADGSHLKELWDRLRAKDADAPVELTQREVLSAAAAGDAYPQAYRAVTEVDTVSQLRALRCPTLVFAGTKDPLYGRVDAALECLADGERAEIPGAGTYACERQAGAVAELLLKFFGKANA